MCDFQSRYLLAMGLHSPARPHSTPLVVLLGVGKVDAGEQGGAVSDLVMYVWFGVEKKEHNSQPHSTELWIKNHRQSRKGLPLAFCLRKNQAASVAATPHNTSTLLSYP